MTRPIPLSNHNSTGKRYPRVLLYGNNYASVINSLATGFEEIGVPVKAISPDYRRSIYNNYDKIYCICKHNNPGKLRHLYYMAMGILKLIPALWWCDVLHIYGRQGNMAFRFFALFKRLKCITFLGSDVRMPETELAVNPYFRYALENEAYENKLEKQNDTPALLRFLTRLKYKFIAWDVDIFIDKRITGDFAIAPHASINRHQTDTSDELISEKVQIIHSPTAPVSKGTAFVLQAIDKLKQKGLPFEFTLLKNISNEAFQVAMQRADIYVDQLMWGAYGVAAQQAMQMGKVVVASLAGERIKKLYGPEIPIQNANIDNLADVLERLILDKKEREEISRRSVEYYQEMHSPTRVAQKMLAAYNLFGAKTSG